MLFRSLLGYDDGDLPMLPEFLLGELDKRLMPEGMEWPRFDDGMKIAWDDAPEDIASVCLALDGSCYVLHYDMPDDERMCIYEVSERVKRPEPDVLAADGEPIKVGETVYLTDDNVPFEVQAVRDGAAQDEFGEWYDAGLLTHAPHDTQERINDDATMHPHEYCKEHGIQAGTPDDAPFTLSDFVEPMTLDLLRRQRELCAKGGE